MNSLLLHLLYSSLLFSVFFLAFKAVLSNHTFHQLNRFILLLFIPASIAIPFTAYFSPTIPYEIVDIPIFEQINIEKAVLLENIKILHPTTDSPPFIIIMYWLGVAVCLFRIIISQFKLINLRNQSIVQKAENYQLIFSNISEVYSYFNWIFIPKNKKGNCDHLIIEHEKTHAKLKHSIDIIITEIYIAFFWFNPLTYWYRKTLKSIHEFQADEGALKTKGVKTSHYLQLILENLEIEKLNTTYSYFKQPIIKKRIEMISQKKSNQILKIKYILLLPILFLSIASFTNSDHALLNAGYSLNTSAIPPSLFPIKNGTKADITSHFGAKRMHPKFKNSKIHTGIDIRAAIGTPIQATADGIVGTASMEGNWGNLIIIAHADGYETLYAHLRGFNCKKNQKVKEGDIIGYTGNSGLSTAPHLHYEIRHNGKKLNPIDYFQQ